MSVSDFNIKAVSAGSLINRFGNFDFDQNSVGVSTYKTSNPFDFNTSAPNLTVNEQKLPQKIKMK